VCLLRSDLLSCTELAVRCSRNDRSPGKMTIAADYLSTHECGDPEPRGITYRSDIWFNIQLLFFS
jgi:hypothetical protein